MQRKAHTWVCDVAREFDTEDREFAYRVLRAWLHTLRDRHTVEAVVGFRRGRAARASSPGLSWAFSLGVGLGSP